MIALIVNPAAGRGRARTRADDVERALRELSDVQRFNTRCAGDERRCASDAVAAGAHVVAVVGGDGSVHHTTRGLLESAPMHAPGVPLAIFAAGTGNPFFTTDTAAALRGAEIGAELVLKATKVDGVYTADPHKDPTATRFTTLSFDEAMRRNLGIMDATAFALCRDQKLPIKVFSIFKNGALKRVVMGEDEGTLVHV